jgi:hypothetical protein
MSEMQCAGVRRDLQSTMWEMSEMQCVPSLRKTYPCQHVEFHSKNKFEILVHLVGFIMRNLSRCTVTWKSNRVVTYLLLGDLCVLCTLFTKCQWHCTNNRACSQNVSGTVPTTGPVHKMSVALYQQQGLFTKCHWHCTNNRACSQNVSGTVPATGPVHKMSVALYQQQGLFTKCQWHCTNKSSSKFPDCSVKLWKFGGVAGCVSDNSRCSCTKWQFKTTKNKNLVPIGKSLFRPC